MSNQRRSRQNKWRNYTFFSARRKNIPKQQFCWREWAPDSHWVSIHCAPPVCHLTNWPWKKNRIVMLLRNLDPTNGHCDGTRYIFQHLYQHAIDAVIACGSHAGKRIVIPKIALIPSENVFSFHKKHKQLPLRSAFAMTYNKAQGQTLQKIGISLQHVFLTWSIVCRHKQGRV